MNSYSYSRINFTHPVLCEVFMPLNSQPRPIKVSQFLSSAVPLQPAQDATTLDFNSRILHFHLWQNVHSPHPFQIILPLTYLAAPSIHTPACFQLPLRYQVTVLNSCDLLYRAKSCLGILSSLPRPQPHPWRKGLLFRKEEVKSSF